MRMAERLPGDWEIDVEDLGNVFSRAKIQSCNACVSTSMALCCWPCNCYKKNSWFEPDLMWNLDLFARLDLADAWAIIGPVNWYAPSSNLKLMFDRLVCMNGGNPREQLIEHKDPELAMELEHSPEWFLLSLNHLEGRTAAFFCHGDGGANETDATGRPKMLSHPTYYNPGEEPFVHERNAYAPLVWQCRYSGIEVPDELWSYLEIGAGKPYSDNQAEDIESSAFKTFDDWTDRFVAFVSNKGKVRPGKYRSFGYKRPWHLLDSIKLAWRDIRLRFGRPPVGSSPYRQKKLGIVKDTTFRPKKGEGDKVRD